MKTINKTFVTIALLTAAILGVSSNAVAQKKVNIKALFWMLPADALPEYLPQSDKQGMESHIIVCDYKNAYLELGGGQFTWEMCYWNLKDGRKLVAVNRNFETGPLLRFFYYENEKLTEDEDYNLFENISIKLEDFIDVSKLNPDIIKKLRKNVESFKYIIYYKLPRKGTSLKLRIDHEAVTEDFKSITYETFKELTIKWVNENG